MLPGKQGMYDPALERDNCGVGMIANLKKTESHRIVKNALQVLERMAHRGGCGCEVNTGDGSGVLFTMPDTFYRQECEKAGVKLPPRGEYGSGLIFFSRKPGMLEKCKGIIEKRCQEHGFKILHWRDVPTNNSTIGPSALACEPKVMQVFVAPTAKLAPEVLETELMILRRVFEREIAEIFIDLGRDWTQEFYPCTLSSKTIVYKGMLTPEQVREYYLDLQNEKFETYLALVHSRFSTNTFPSWSRAQPMRMLCHNGEINTLKGNANWMSARESVILSPKLGKEKTQMMLPVIDKSQSDSGSYDNVLEFMYHGSNRTLAECMLMMIPEPWQNDGNIDEDTKAFYKFYSNVMEPWDGPAMIAFTNGDVIGATLDRNGLRPSRYYVTDSNGSGVPEEVILSSEVGCLQDVVPVESIIERGRLRPGQIFMVDLKEGCIVRDKELKKQLSTNAPFREWVDGMIPLSKVIEVSPKIPEDQKNLRATNRLLTAHGYTTEAVDTIITPMGATGKEALGSMGNDAPLACLSLKPRLLYEYFKQLFAQVTNPPIDPLRESLIMSLKLPLGPEGNLLDKAGNQSERIDVECPLLSLEEMHALKHMDHKGYKTYVVDCTIPYEDPSNPPSKEVLLKELDRIEKEAADAVRKGFKIICLSDKKVSDTRVPIDSMLAVGCVHQYLIKQKLRTLSGLILESGSAHQVHHYALLFGMGADAVCPYLCYHALHKARDEGRLGMQYTDAEITDRVKSAFDYGVRKVMAKMGISTLQSYRGAQIFEALGISSEIIDRAFTGTPSRIGGVTFDILLEDMLKYHDMAFPKDPESTGYKPNYGIESRFTAARVGGVFDSDDDKFSLPNLGDFHYRDGGELHYNAPEQMAMLQEAARKNSREAYEKYMNISHKLVQGVTLRGQLTFNTTGVTPISIDEVEPTAEIVKRFTTGAMSLGSISAEAHETLALAMNRLGAKSNTGEGGESEERLVDPSRRSAIKQIASGRFGVTANYLTNAIQLQIKMAQGAKPGEGGELPGFKVSMDIGKLRHSTPGVGLISPPPHHDIYSIEDLAQLIYDLKCSNPAARISVKLVSEVGVGVVAAGVAKAKADHILISGHDGGTGAAQWGGIKSTGLPWELGLAEAHQTLVINDLRSRVILETDGQMKTGLDVIMAFMLGAEECGFSTAPLISIGCIMMRKCHLNVCPVGIATQDPELRKKFKGLPEHVVNFLWMIGEEVRMHMAKIGIRKIDDLIGRSDLLKFNEEIRNKKTKNLDLSSIITPAFTLPGLINPKAITRSAIKQDHELEKHIDNIIIPKAKEALESKKPVTIETEIINIQRSCGTMLSHEISKRYGEAGLPDDTITIKVHGSTGQSFGAFLTKGVTMIVTGDANDGTGKGLCGGKIVVNPDPRNLKRGFVAEDNIITGNVALYGATSGRAFFRGIAAERFAVRNSGAITVVEGCGDHGLEYMTGGRAVILGEVGKNFSAGMSGGIAWVYDPKGQLRYKANFAEPMRDFERLEGDIYEQELIGYIKEHLAATGSTVAKSILDNWEVEREKFVQVFPLDYKRARKQAADADSWKGREESHKEKNLEIDMDAKKIKVQAHTPSEKEIATKFNKLRGFVEIERIPEPYREPSERLTDWGEIYTPVKAHDAERKRQAARCMDCGTPFCQTHSGCPIHNLMPEWNELVFKEQWKTALDRLLTTNNFPEFTGRVCPAPCEGACVAGLVAAPVTIKNIEYAIIDRGFKEGWVKPRIPKDRTGLTVAIVGSGPAGLAAADELNQMGHKVTVFERDSKPGGLLMFGIPNMKLDKRVVQRRLEIMQSEGIDFICNVEVGKDVTADQLKSKFDAVLLTVGATKPRDLPIPGRNLKNIYFAMEFLGKQQQALFRQNPELMTNAISFRTPYKGNKDWKLEYDGSFIDVRGKRVVVIGGGDTGTDCTATSVRHGCKSLVNLELLDKPPPTRDEIANAWPAYPRIFRTDYGQEEVKKRDGADPRKYAVMTKEFIGDEQGNVKAIKIVSLKVARDANGKPTIAEIEGSEQLIETDAVILAMGFVGPDPNLVEAFKTEATPQSNIKAMHGSNGDGYRTSVDGVFAAGDCRRGQSLVVWAINEGQRAADAVNRFLLESRTQHVSQSSSEGVKRASQARSFHTRAQDVDRE
uniref:glutamate synthase (NADH) n=1 Tax=Guillardia theta TaxID=55529 RepID=A0A7S4P9N1_GUITH